jgi:ABC-type sugar transport system substrate-binding protein
MAEGRISRRGLLAATGGGALAGAAMFSPAALAEGQAVPKLKGKQRFVWVSANIGDPFYQDGLRGMRTFSQYFGVTCSFVGPQKNDIAGMVKAFQATVADPRTTGIFSYFYGGFDAVKPLYEQAAKKGIPIVNSPSDWGGPRAAFLGIRDEDAPRVCAAYINTALGGKGKVGHIGNTGINIVREEKIFRDIIKTQYKGLTYLGNATHNGSAADAIKQFQAFKTAHPDLDVVFFGDGLGPSIAEPLAAAAQKTQLILRGFGANGIKGVQDGKILALIDRNPWDEEFYGFQLLYWYKVGRRVPDTTIISTFTVDKSNVDKFAKDPYVRS